MNPIRNPIKNVYGCTNKVSQYISMQYDTKVIEVKCGATDLDGSTLVCDKCEEKWDKKNPEGLHYMYGGDDDYDDDIN